MAATCEGFSFQSKFPYSFVHPHLWNKYMYKRGNIKTEAKKPRKTKADSQVKTHFALLSYIWHILIISISCDYYKWIRGIRTKVWMEKLNEWNLHTGRKTGLGLWSWWRRGYLFLKYHVQLCYYTLSHHHTASDSRSMSNFIFFPNILEYYLLHYVTQWVPLFDCR